MWSGSTRPPCAADKPAARTTCCPPRPKTPAPTTSAVDLESFTEFGILPAFAGIAVHDRYSVYFHPRWDTLAGHQACTAHLLRDLAAAETYPDTHWPAQAQRALRGGRILSLQR